MLLEMIKKTRSYRRFDQSIKIERETLVELVNLARFGASGGNLQPLKYILSYQPDKNEAIFKHLRWAAYLKDWNGPEEGEKPTAYIVILGDTNIAKDFRCDQGIAAQNIMLGATEKGLGGCILGSIDKKGLRESLNIPERYEILWVIALGKPIEKVVLEDVGEDGNIKYWRDDKGVHHVPKRILEELILED